MKPWYAMSEDIKGIPVSRWIASWYIGGGSQSKPMVKRWLKTIVVDGEPFTEEEINTLSECIVCGKLELQESVKKFIAQ